MLGFQCSFFIFFAWFFSKPVWKNHWFEKLKTKKKFESKDIKTYPLYQLNLKSDQHLISPLNNTAKS